MSPQLTLCDDGPAPGPGQAHSAALDRMHEEARALAARLPEGVHFGTSSWKYEGWLGSIYREAHYRTRGKFSRTKFEVGCLREYAETFPAVCGDFAFYQFPRPEYWADLFGSTPAGFVFGLKVPEDITVATGPGHARYGKRAGLQNEHFLDAGVFERFFAQPLAPYREQLGPLPAGPARRALESLCDFVADRTS